jgi:hypothetical protein
LLLLLLLLLQLLLLLLLLLLLFYFGVRVRRLFSFVAGSFKGVFQWHVFGYFKHFQFMQH